MQTQIFVNLPVKDLRKSIAFFTSLGFTFDPQFTDETATCMIIADNIFAMLLTEAKFKEFTRKQVADAHKTTEVLTCISFETRAKVDTVVNAALKAGGSEAREVMDLGFMYHRSFNDLDGHIWEIVYMDPNAAAP